MSWKVKSKYAKQVQESKLSFQSQNDRRQEQRYLPAPEYAENQEQMPEQQDVFKLVREELIKSKIGKDSFVKKQVDKTDFSLKFTEKTGGAKSRDLTDEQKQSIERKTANSDNFQKLTSQYNSSVTDRLNDTLKLFENSSKRKTTKEMLAVGFFLTGEREADAKRLQAFSGRDAAQRHTVINDMVYQYLTLDFSSVNIQTDEAFVQDSSRLLDISRKTEALQYLLRQNPEYTGRLTPDQFEKLRAKLQYGNRIRCYYSAASGLITDDYYKSHANSELSVTADDFDRNDKEKEQKKNFRTKYWLASLYKKGLSIEDTTQFDAFLKLVKQKQDLAQDVADLIHQTGPLKADYAQAQKGAKERYDQVAHGGYESKPAFWRMRRFFSFIGIRYAEKRTGNHGAGRYEESIQKMKYIPQAYRNIAIVPGTRLTMIKGTPDVPEVPISGILKNDRKASFYDKAGDFRRTHQQAEGIHNEHIEKILASFECYSQLQILSNKDTFEMEMAFIDTIDKELKNFQKDFPAYCDGKGKQFFADLKALQEDLLAGSGGSLEQDFDQKLRAIDAEIHAKNNQLRDADPEGVQADDLAEEVRALNAQKSANRLAQKSYNNCKQYAQGIYDDHGISNNLYESNVSGIPLFTHEPCIADVTQGAIGDCWFMSTLAAIVKVSPDAIKNMFQDLGNGDVIVRLYAPYDKKNKRRLHEIAGDDVEFKAEFFKVRKHYETGSNGATGCMWPQLLEKAFAAANIHKPEDDSFVQIKDGKMQYMSSQLTARNPTDLLSVITGTYYKEELVLSAAEDFAEKKATALRDMKRIFRNNGAITFACKTHCLTGLDMRTTPDGQVYFLIRDPFNVYQHTYDTIDGKTEHSQDGIVETFWRNRSLNQVESDTEANKAKAHAGLSWWKLEDVFPAGSNWIYLPVTKQHFTLKGAKKKELF